MPNFRSHSIFELVRDVRAFVNLDFGVTRGSVPDYRALEARLKEKELELARAKSIVKQQRKAIENRGRRIEVLESGLAEGRISNKVGIHPENIVWIFGHGRTGSTWLSRMMGDIEDHTVWFEPSVGDLFGSFYYTRARPGQRRSKIFVLGDRQRETWIESIRNFVLDGAEARFPKVGGEQFLIVKEPHGSIGAPLLMEALPESRMILLIRDPRDVAASALDAFRKGSWAYKRHQNDNVEGLVTANERPDDFVRSRADSYLRSVGKAKEAYESHSGRKILVKYEDLLANPLKTMRRIYSELEMEVAGEDLVHVIEKYSWESIPEGERGPGKFYRKASPGSWREDLTVEQTNTIEQITSPILEEFYSS